MALRALIAALVLVACAGPEPPPEPPVVTHAMTAGEVEQLFAAWVCPPEPSLTISLLRPQATRTGAGSWSIVAGGSEYTMRESTRNFVEGYGGMSVSLLRTGYRCAR